MTYFYEQHKQRGLEKTVRYTAVGKPNADMPPDHYPAATVDLYREQERPNFVMGFPNNADADNPPTELFTNRPGRVMGAFADDTMRAHLSTLLGIAADRNMRDTGGRLPMPSRSLSKHSSAMVQKLEGRGIKLPTNPKNPTNKVTNGIEKQDVLVHEYDEGIAEGKLMDPAEVRSGRDLMRNMLRRTAANPTQFGQS